jgi:hypothetical protein
MVSWLLSKLLEYLVKENKETNTSLTTFARGMIRQLWNKI